MEYFMWFLYWVTPDKTNAMVNQITDSLQENANFYLFVTIYDPKHFTNLATSTNNYTLLMMEYNNYNKKQ